MSTEDLRGKSGKIESGEPGKTRFRIGSIEPMDLARIPSERAASTNTPLTPEDFTPEDLEHFRALHPFDVPTQEIRRNPPDRFSLLAQDILEADRQLPSPTGQPTYPPALTAPDTTPLSKQPVSQVIDLYIARTPDPEEQARARVVLDILPTISSPRPVETLSTQEAASQVLYAAGLPMVPVADLPLYQEAFLFLRDTLGPWIQPPEPVALPTSQQLTRRKEIAEERYTREILIGLRTQAEGLLRYGEREKAHFVKRIGAVLKSSFADRVSGFKKQFQKAVEASESILREIPFQTADGTECALVLHANRGNPETAVISLVIVGSNTNKFLVLSNPSPVTNAYTGKGVVMYTEDHREFDNITNRKIRTRFDGKKYKYRRPATLADAVAYQKLLSDLGTPRISHMLIDNNSY